MNGTVVAIGTQHERRWARPGPVATVTGLQRLASGGTRDDQLRVPIARYVCGHGHWPLLSSSRPRRSSHTLPTLRFIHAQILPATAYSCICSGDFTVLFLPRSIAVSGFARAISDSRQTRTRKDLPSTARPLYIRQAHQSRSSRHSSSGHPVLDIAVPYCRRCATRKEAFREIRWVLGYMIAHLCR
jgi:hypothetical protein